MINKTHLTKNNNVHLCYKGFVIMSWYEIFIAQWSESLQLLFPMGTHVHHSCIDGVPSKDTVLINTENITFVHKNWVSIF